VATCSRDKTLRLWPFPGGPEAEAGARVFVGHTNFVAALAWAPPGALAIAPDGALVSGSRDGDVIVWHTGAASPLQRLSGHKLQVRAASLPRSLPRPPLTAPQVSAVCVTAAGEVVSGDLGGEIRVWKDGACAQLVPGSSPVLSLASLPGGGFVASSGNPDCAIASFKPADALLGGGYARAQAHPKAHADAVRCVRLHPAGALLLSASHDGTARLWSGDGARGCLAEYVGHSALLYAVGASGDGQLVATASEDCTARVWDCQSGAQRAALPHPACVWDVAWLPDGDLVTACGDGVARCVPLSLFSHPCSRRIAASGRATPPKQTRVWRPPSRPAWRRARRRRRARRGPPAAEACRPACRCSPPPPSPAPGRATAPPSWWRRTAAAWRTRGMRRRPPGRRLARWWAPPAAAAAAEALRAASPSMWTWRMGRPRASWRMTG